MNVSTALRAVKFGGSMVTGFALGAVARNVLKTVTPESTNKLAKGCIYLGSAIAASLAADAASDKFDRKLDLGIRLWEVFTQTEQSKPEVQTITINKAEV